MHIPDGVLSPTVAAATSLLGAGGLAVAVRKLGRPASAERTTVMMGILAAFVFAAQMVNFPVGPGVSGHLLGGVLAAVILGPWAGAVVIAAVLVVQCLLFADGGLTALGANFVNMGLVGAIGGSAIYRPLRRALGDGPRGTLVGAVLAAWFSVILASGAFAIELALSGRASQFGPILGWMLLVHAAIGLGEAAITGLVLSTVLAIRPDLIASPDAADSTPASPLRQRTQTVLAGLGVALAICLFLAPLASAHPDGLEYVGSKLAFLPDEGAVAGPQIPAPMPDYEMPGLTLGLATAAAGAVGTLFVFGLAFAIAWAHARSAALRAEDRVSTHAA
jgi:cobalt/nickel transport system permease protein